MKVVCFGDNHGVSLEKVLWPEGDVLVCVGDFSDVGNIIDVKVFANELGELPYKYKIVIAGNHDWAFQENNDVARAILREAGLETIYLQDDVVGIEGVRFYGTPWTSLFNDWAFMKPEEELFEIYSNIPKNVDVLISHGPPFGILDKVLPKDECAGGKSLLETIKVKKPYFHVFGHIHEGYGEAELNGIETHFINCSLLDEKYKLVNSPVIFEI